MYYKSEWADPLATKQIVVNEIIQQFIVVYLQCKNCHPNCFLVYMLFSTLTREYSRVPNCEYLRVPLLLSNS